MAADDFRLSLDVKLVGNRGNSGIQFRSEALPDGEMRGYQADVGAGWWGKLYEENGRGLLVDKSGEQFVKAGEWNHYEISARGQPHSHLDQRPIVRRLAGPIRRATRHFRLAIALGRRHRGALQEPAAGVECRRRRNGAAGQ